MKLALFSLFLLLFIFGCAKEAVQETEEIVDEEPVAVPETETTGNEDVDSVGSSIDDFDFGSGLDDSELDSLDQDLAGLDW